MIHIDEPQWRSTTWQEFLSCPAMGRCRDCGTCRFFTSGWPRWPLEPGGPFLNRIMFRLPFNMFNVEEPATKAQIGFPLALKNLGPGCIHKPDSGHFFQGSINWSALLALEADQWLAEENQLLREFAHLPTSTGAGMPHWSWRNHGECAKGPKGFRYIPESFQDLQTFTSPF